MDSIALIQIETFTDLPAHPFLNRIAMYVVPTALLVALAALVRPGWRRRLAPWSFGLAVAALLSVQLTMGAGEVMDNVIHGDANPLVEDHEDWSKLLRIGLIGLVLATGYFAWGERRRARRETTGDEVPARATPMLASMLAVVALAIAGNTYLTVMTAHSGSKSVYEEDGKLLTGETAQPDRP
jgi:hypothetical protein